MPSTYRRKYKPTPQIHLTEADILAFLAWNQNPEGTYFITQHIMNEKGDKIEVRLPVLKFTTPVLKLRGVNYR